VQSETSIRHAGAALDAALEAGDLDQVVSCFAGDCVVELLGVRLTGHAGVRRWLDWVFGHVDRIELTPRLISVDGDQLIEEFKVGAVLPDGDRLQSEWAEVLTYQDDLVTSLRLYFDPIDFAPALGLPGRLMGPVLTRFARRGLEPFEPIRELD
jgi:ketosteroid isomerase-like protein